MSRGRIPGWTGFAGFLFGAAGGLLAQAGPGVPVPPFPGAGPSPAALQGPFPALPTYPPDITFAPAPGVRTDWASAGCCRVGVRILAVSLVAGQRAFASVEVSLVGPDGQPAPFPPLRPDGTAQVEVFVDLAIARAGRLLGRQVVMCLGAGPAELMMNLPGMPPGLPPDGSYQVEAAIHLADPGTRGQAPQADDTEADDRDQAELVYPAGILRRADVGAGADEGSPDP